MATKNHHKLNYMEFSSSALQQTQDFLAKAFGWEFVDYGDDYKDIQGAGVGGGLVRRIKATTCRYSI